MSLIQVEQSVYDRLSELAGKLGRERGAVAVSFSEAVEHLLEACEP